jgi:NAD(P)-dependent dehydrogenase (short-subunit alcohol dehydrogenase family)
MSTMLITGASRGIGAATALVAAEAGWNVAITASASVDDLESVASQVRALGVSCLTIIADVATEADVMRMFAESVSAFGSVDCLVNNAGIAPGYGPFAELSLADIERTMAVNVTGALLCAREAVRHMSTALGGVGGSIVNVSSKAAVIGGPGEWIHYAASKGAVESMTSGLAKEVAAQRIRVNAVRPGLVDHGFGPWAPEGRTDRMAPLIPMGRPGTAREVANAIVWLASDAASYVTGTFIDATGGR